MPETDQAEVSMTFEDGEPINSLSFNLGKTVPTATLQLPMASGLRKAPSAGSGSRAGKSRLTYRVKISHERDNKRFDARMTPDWALFRGDNLVPSAAMSIHDKTELVARLQFDLPKGWPAVETGWPRIGKNKFRIDNPLRKFDRPTGWMLAGKIGSRRAQLGLTDVTVAAPKDEGMHRMDVLTLLTFIWPEMQSVFPRDPAKLLIVGAGDPMWRGGLSASNSYFMHADRPLVSENGTSSLVHELVHVFSRINDADKSDWISEGLAEYYAIELMRRAGGMSEDRYQIVRKKLIDWSRPVKSLRTENSTGPVTARAVLLFQELDREIRKATKDANGRSLDDVARGLMRLDKVTTKDLIDISESVMGKPSDVLDTKLLK
uniref:Peptidase M61 catalytic domain-containing protein n=1 Tax=Pseudomonas marincola TaxID=437900 RepID=A0A653DXN3_9PSED